MTAVRSTDPRADAAAAALGRLADLHVCDSDDYRDPPEFCVEDGQDWPCDVARVLGLARRIPRLEGAVILLNSLVLSGEDHSETSRAAVRAALSPDAKGGSLGE